jgi:hypothetical protein
VTGSIGTDIVAPFGGMTFKALDIGAADSAGSGFNEDLIRFQFGELYLFHAKIMRPVHKGYFGFHSATHLSDYNIN